MTRSPTLMSVPSFLYMFKDERISNIKTPSLSFICVFIIRIYHPLFPDHLTFCPVILYESNIVPLCFPVFRVSFVLYVNRVLVF